MSTDYVLGGTHTTTADAEPTTGPDPPWNTVTSATPERWWSMTAGKACPGNITWKT